MKTYLQKAALVLCAFLVFSCSKDDAPSDNASEETISEETASETSIEDEILKLVNEYRANLGKSILVNNDTARDLAIVHTHYMISVNKIDHANFDASFKELREKENASGAGENVASGYRTARTVVDGWLSSTGHRKNIEGNFTHSGIAAIKNEKGRYFFTQLFYR